MTWPATREADLDGSATERETDDIKQKPLARESSRRPGAAATSVSFVNSSIVAMRGNP